MGNDTGKIEQPDVRPSYADDVAAMIDTNSGTVLSSSAVARWRQNDTRCRSRSPLSAWNVIAD